MPPKPIAIVLCVAEAYSTIPLFTKTYCDSTLFRTIAVEPEQSYITDRTAA
jgi:hypothetical protein